ncbi:hypothetical protein E2544_07000 [Achromobacter insolitus]|nr:hypothetical protein E2544_07000 [Achromobacter insolitus]
MGRPGGREGPPRCARCACLLPPEGGCSPLGRPGGETACAPQLAQVLYALGFAGRATGWA